MLFKVLLAGMCSLCLVGTATLASAHEFIVKPDKTQAAKGESVGVQAQAAHVFMISEEAEPVETVVVELIQGNAKEPVKLAEDAKVKALVGKAALPADGPAMIVGHRLPQTWSDTTEGVLEGGRKDLEAKGKKVLKVGKYEKFAKTMLNPAANDGLYKKVLGHDLEICLLYTSGLHRFLYELLLRGPQAGRADPRRAPHQSRHRRHDFPRLQAGAHHAGAGRAP